MEQKAVTSRPLRRWPSGMSDDLTVYHIGDLVRIENKRAIRVRKKYTHSVVGIYGEIELSIDFLRVQDLNTGKMTDVKPE